MTRLGIKKIFILQKKYTEMWQELQKNVIFFSLTSNIMQIRSTEKNIYGLCSTSLSYFLLSHFPIYFFSYASSVLISTKKIDMNENKNWEEEKNI